MEHFTYIIIGAGPAGLQMAYFMEKAGYDPKHVLSLLLVVGSALWTWRAIARRRRR